MHTGSTAAQAIPKWPCSTSLKLYGQRVTELHLRQSKNNVWSETFGDGDIDYRALWKTLREKGVNPLLVLEQGPENEIRPQTIEDSPKPIATVAATRKKCISPGIHDGPGCNQTGNPNIEIRQFNMCQCQRKSFAAANHPVSVPICSH